ncbi:hypothetical protein [Nitrospirillum amazonense]|uniref:Uncharacterized protein n=1 Tax=Nitrospirillum amazonense TaxID=28077 RepID=A0A560KPH8_9PROT|nr:hypothetical protein [Nitrospirillum amazonense]MDG3443270.1 hypothetical protein [Nitrospirillum amazonense]TWB82590.1 hypothetical protein FBZ87_101298 [Nitrospirillum amazonense]
MDIVAGETPLAISATLGSTLAIAVSALAHRSSRRRRAEDDEDVGLAERVAVLASRLERAERDIANDKQGRQAFAAAQGEMKAVVVQLAALATQIEALGTKLDRQSQNLTRAHERIDDLHRLAANQFAQGVV